ncbi:hypothetical protein RR48_05667 [Papilio machaon]|uniref:Uncharacterized protein n=1 Tax=Papilio machaon TaxID=76193 RepID=A0A0N1IPR2_PAPMA|nr:hypothetical protein RR48_05667 [Papilio machaon]
MADSDTLERYQQWKHSGTSRITTSRARHLTRLRWSAARMRLSAAERDVRRVGRPRANGLSYHLSTNWRESERLHVTCRKEKGSQHLVPLYRRDCAVTDSGRAL